MILTDFQDEVNQEFFSPGCSCHSEIIFVVAFIPKAEQSGKTGLTASSVKFRTNNYRNSVSVFSFFFVFALQKERTAVAIVSISLQLQL